MLTAIRKRIGRLYCGCSRYRGRGDKGRSDRKFLEALHYFVVHNITWCALPEKFGRWNSVRKRFWRLSLSGQQMPRHRCNAIWRRESQARSTTGTVRWCGKDGWQKSRPL